MRSLTHQHAAQLPHGRRLVGLAAENRRDVEDRGERIAQLVREHGQKLVLAPVRLQQARLAVEELAVRDLQVVQQLDQRRAHQDEECDVRDPAERIVPAEVFLEEQGAEHRAGQRDQPGGPPAAEVAGHQDRQNESEQRAVPADQRDQLRAEK
ncbi:MAG TPA: hypothetical protein VJN68_00875, partial [Burkholderiaceae bacterium]|nr:hypothetical protein [Burkholderiaceae bacterium]